MAIKKLFEGDNLDKLLLDGLYVDPETGVLFMRVDTEESLINNCGVTFNKIMTYGKMDCMDGEIIKLLVRFVRSRMRKIFP